MYGHTKYGHAQIRITILVELKTKTKNFPPTQHQIWEGAKTSKGRGNPEMNKLTSSPLFASLLQAKRLNRTLFELPVKGAL